MVEEEKEEEEVRVGAFGLVSFENWLCCCCCCCCCCCDVSGDCLPFLAFCFVEFDEMADVLGCFFPLTNI